MTKKINKPTKRAPAEPSIKKTRDFFVDVYDVVRQIPKGRVTSYGAIANYLGTKLSSRMVGWAMNGAHNINPKVPAHRVVNRNGMLTGRLHFSTPDEMENLLKAEGIEVTEHTVTDFKALFWDPATNLSF